MFAILGLAVFLFSYQLGNRYAQPEKPDTSAYLLPEAIALMPFSLTDEEGAAFDTADFKNYWTLVIVGDHQHAGCKRLLTLYVLAWNRLAHDRPLQNMTRVAFLSLAASGYTVSELKSYIEFMHPDFIALTGDKADLDQLSVQLGLPEDDNKSVQCSEQNGIVALINPDSELNALFTGISDPAVIAHDLETIAHQ